MSKRRFRRLASLSAALAAGASAQTIPVHPVGKIVATSTDAYGDVFGVRVLSDGRVLVNDSRFRRVVLLDTALRPLTVVADTSTSTSRAYGARPGNLIAYGGDTTIFVDPASNSFLFIDPKGAIVRTAAPPRPTDIATFATPSSAVTYDGRGSLVYRPPLLPRLGLVQPQDDSTPLVRVNLTSHALDTIAMLRRGILHAIVVPCAAGTSIVPGPDRTCMTTPRAPFTSGDEWALLSTGAIAVIRSIDYHVDWVTPDGKRTATPKVAHEWTRLTDSAKRWLVDSLRVDDSVSRMARPTSVAPRFVEPDSIPDFRPPFLAATSTLSRGDADGRLWVRELPDGQPGAVYDIIDGSGKIVDRVRIPGGANIVGFGHGSVYLASREAAGVRVARALIH